MGVVVIDPRQVPVTGTYHHLTAIPGERLTPESLRTLFRTDCQRRVGAESHGFIGPPPRQAAVLVPVVLHARPTVLLTQRTQHLRKHAGQIAFPGGKIDESDADAIAAALREAQEEVGLRPLAVEVLGTLDRFSMNPFYGVTPVVGLVQPGTPWEPNPHEVADVFEVPLDFLMNPAHHRRHVLDVEGHHREWISMPYPDPTGERFIWGATAGMLHDFYLALAASL